MNGPDDDHGVAEPGDGDPAAAKRALRDLVLERRDSLAGEQRLACGEALRARLTALPVVAGARTMMCFASFRSEVDTAPLVGWCLERGVAVALPRILAPHQMEAFAVTAPGRDLIAGRFGIPEPRPGLAHVEPAAIDVVIVPGSAFDRGGGRIGYGGGFYDTFLRRTRPDTRRIGIAFDLQVVEHVPREAHDLCVDLVVTEKRTIVTGCRPLKRGELSPAVEPGSYPSATP